jgi:hypothetical protein
MATGDNVARRHGQRHCREKEKNTGVDKKYPPHTKRISPKDAVNRASQQAEPRQHTKKKPRCGIARLPR